LLSQLLTLYITPVLYIYLDNLGTRIGGFRLRRALPGTLRGAPAE
jgi:hypothetical protein